MDFWDIWSLRLSGTASRFEVGSPSAISFVGAAEVIKMLLNFGIGEIEKRVLKLTDRLIEAVKSSKLTLQTPEDPHIVPGLLISRLTKPQEV